MESSVFLVVTWVTLMASVSGDVDYEFCRNNLAASAPTAGWNPPKFRDQFYVLAERKLFSQKTWKGPKNNVLNNYELFFDQKDQIAKMTIIDEEGTLDAWYLPDVDAILVQPRNLGENCLTQDFKDSPMTSYLGASPADDNTGKWNLGFPSEAMGWARGLEYFNYSQVVESDRGFPVKVVQACSHHLNHGITNTNAGIFWFSDPSQIKMPGDTELSTLVAAKIKAKDDKGGTYDMRYDFTHQQYGVTPETNPNFKRPLNHMVCDLQDKTFEKPLPKLTTRFRYRFELTKYYNVGSMDETVATSSFRVSYNHGEGIYIEDTLSASAKLTESREDRIVNYQDYKTGVQYEVNKVTGACRQTQIDETLAAKYDDNKNVQIKTPEEYFWGTSSQVVWRYQGQTDVRGIQCDSWAVFLDDAVDDTGSLERNAMYHWYFATDEWVTENRPMLKGISIPVQLNVDHSRYVGEGLNQHVSNYFSYFIYDFDHDWKYYEIPEINACFSPDRLMNIAFLVEAPYTKFIGTDIPNARSGILISVMAVGSFTHVFRINKLDIQTYDIQHTLILMTILDPPLIKGNVNYTWPDAMNEDIWKFLKSATDSGTFTIDIIRPTLKTDSYKVAKGSLQQYDPKVYDPFKDPNLVPGGNTGGNTGGRTGGNSGSSGGDSGNSDGAMAGLGIGLFLLGILVTAVAGYLFYKFKVVPGGGDTLAMSNIS